jgi:hypothetical protein
MLGSATRSAVGGEMGQLDASARVLQGMMRGQMAKEAVLLLSGETYEHATLVGLLEPGSNLDTVEDLIEESASSPPLPPTPPLLEDQRVHYEQRADASTTVLHMRDTLVKRFAPEAHPSPSPSA